MKERSKYYALYTFLLTRQEPTVSLTLHNIEEMISAKLPHSAYRYRGWWSNRNRGAVQSNAWLNAGFEVAEVSLEEGQIDFRKIKQPIQVSRIGNTIIWNGALVRRLRRHMGLTQQELADELGVRQQTISEWETNTYTPSRAMSKYLGLVAEKVKFEYEIKESSD